MPNRQHRNMASHGASRSGTATPTGTHGSMTMTSTESGPSSPITATQGTLRLRAEADTTERRRIQWAEDVVDNEGMGKKSSKVCCIYHKPREAGDLSSSDSSSSSSSDSEGSDSEPDTSRAQPSNRKGHHHQHHHSHDHDVDDSAKDPIPDEKGGTSGNKGKGKARQPSPNAYEKVPKRREHKT